MNTFRIPVRRYLHDWYISIGYMLTGKGVEDMLLVSGYNLCFGNCI